MKIIIAVLLFIIALLVFLIHAICRILKNDSNAANPNTFTYRNQSLTPYEREDEERYHNQ